MKDGLKDLEPPIVKIRATVRYIRSSPTRLEKFKVCIEEKCINEKGIVCLDVDTMRNSTFFMLEYALKFRKIFCNFESQGSLYIQKNEKAWWST